MLLEEEIGSVDLGHTPTKLGQLNYYATSKAIHDAPLIHCQTKGSYNAM
jgi:hypothetical protein